MNIYIYIYIMNSIEIMNYECIYYIMNPIEIMNIYIYYIMNWNDDGELKHALEEI